MMAIHYCPTIKSLKRKEMNLSIVAKRKLIYLGICFFEVIHIIHAPMALHDFMFFSRLSCKQQFGVRLTRRNKHPNCTG